MRRTFVHLFLYLSSRTHVDVFGGQRALRGAAPRALWVLLVAAVAALGCTTAEGENAASGSGGARAAKVGTVSQALCGAAECSIGAACYADGATDASNVCNVCRPSSRTDGWSRVQSEPCTAGLRGDYFANSNLAGTPVFSRVDENLTNWFWSPGAPLGPENFSVRWTGQIVADVTERVTFVLQLNNVPDDSARLWVDGVLVLTGSGGSIASGTFNFIAGVRYDVRFEFQHGSGDAIVDFQWFSESYAIPWDHVPASALYAAALPCAGCSDTNACTRDLCAVTAQCVHPPAPDGATCTGGLCQAGACCTGCDDGDPCTADLCVDGGGCSHPAGPNGVACNGGTCQTGACCAAGDDSCMAGLHGDYFASSDLSGTPVFSRIDQHLTNWYWSPGAPLGTENFSVRWTGQIVGDVTERFTFYLFLGNLPDDAARLWIDDKLVLQVEGGNGVTGTFDFEAGVRYDIRFEYQHGAGDAIVDLGWQSESFAVPWQPVPASALYAAAIPCTGCSDGNVCTRDMCTRTGECAHPLTTDGTSCGSGGICQTGTCCTGCDDGDPCTTDLCLEGGGCSHPAAPNGVACNGGTCQTGSCCAAGDSSCMAGLHGDYFANPDFTGDPAYSRIDPNIANFFWSPGAPLGSENFSVRWTGQIVPDVTERFTFELQGDYRARLWVNCVLVVESADGVMTAGTMDLVAGVRYDIRVEYQHLTDAAIVLLKWYSESFTVPWQPIPSSNLYAAPLACPQCNDGDPNTADMCTRSGGCAHLPDSSTPCNGAICRAGTCLNDCDDGNPCTVDNCNAPGGPTHTLASAGTSCSDGNVCNGAETCNASGVCMSGAAPVIDDGNPCTTDTCSPTAGPSHTPVPAGSSCADGNACNGAESCSASGTCVSGTPPTVDDGNPCTIDACDPLTGATHVPVAVATFCDDGNACNGREACDTAGNCTPGSAPVVDDGNRCTTDSCDPATGAVHTPVAAGTSCADGSACNGVEVCDAAGACQPGVPPQVDDGNPCTVDSCNAAIGTVHTPVNDGTACPDGDLCNGDERCAAGLCAQGVPPGVDDGNPCTTDTCDASTGVRHTAVAAGTACDDGNACTSESCDGSGHCASTAVSVDDGDPCTTDSCDAQGVHHLLSSTCGLNAQGGAMENKASIVGRVRVCGAGPVQGFTVSVFDAPATGAPRQDVVFSTDPSDGSFFVHLDAFPTTAPIATPPKKLIIRIAHPSYITAERRVYARPGDILNIGDIQLLARDVSATVIGPAGGTAADSSGNLTLVFPAGALSAPTPIRITRVPDRACFPAPLPDTTLTNFGVVFEPEGLSFNTPVTVRIRNTQGLPNGACIPGGNYDEATGEWKHVGTATFDGQVFTTTISHFSRYDWNLARLPFDSTFQQKRLLSFNRDDITDNVCGGGPLTTGSVRSGVSTPAYVRQGKAHAFTLRYDSGLAAPHTKRQMAGSSSTDLFFSGGAPQLKDAPPLLIGRTPAAFELTGISVPCGTDGVCDTFKPQTPPTSYKAEYCILGGCQTISGPRSGEEIGFSVPANVKLPLTKDFKLPRSQYVPFRYSVTLQPDTVAFGGCSTFGVQDTRVARQVATGQQVGPDATIQGYEFIPQRIASPYGRGWGASKELHRAPDGSRADLLGPDCVETFRPKAVVKQLLPNGGLGLGTRAAARDPVTSEQLIAKAPGNIWRVNADGTLTVLFSGLGFASDVTNLAIGYVGSERRILVALADSIVEVAPAGAPRRIATFASSYTDPLARAGLAASRGFAYYTTPADELIRRISLADPNRSISVISAAPGGDISMDPEGPLEGVSLRTPRGLSAGDDGSLYVTSLRRHAVYRIRPQADGTVGPQSTLERIAGTGSGAYIDAQHSAPGLDFAISEPMELSTAPDGTVQVGTAYGVAAWDPATQTARWIAFDLGYGGVNARQVDFQLHTLGNLLATSAQSFMAQVAGGALSVDSSKLSSLQDFTKTIAFSEVGAELTDVSSNTKETYEWADETKTVAVLTQTQTLHGELLLRQTFVPRTTNVATVQDVTGDVLTVAYDSNGKLKSITDAAGRTTTVSTDGEGKVGGVILPGNRADFFTYDGDGRLTSISMQSITAGAHFAYDERGNVIRIEDPTGASEDIASPGSLPTPDHVGTLAGSYTDARGQTHAYQVDRLGQVVADTFVADGKSYDIRLTYAPKLNGTFEGGDRLNTLLRPGFTSINGVQLTETFGWNTDGVLTKNSPPAGAATDACSDPWAYTYDPSGRLQTVDPTCTNIRWQVQRDANGRITRKFDDSGKQVNQIIPTGREELFTWRPDGQLATSTEHSILTTYSYDPATGNRTSAVDSLGRTTNFGYDAAGNVTSIDNGASITLYGFDDANRQTSQTDGAGNVSTYVYGDGQHVTFSRTPDLPAGKGWTRTYDAAGRLATFSTPDGYTTNFGYQPGRGLTSVTDALGRTTTVERDGLGRPSRMSNGAGAVTTFAYPVPTAGAFQGATVIAVSPDATPAVTTLTGSLRDGEHQFCEFGYRPGDFPADFECYRDATFQLEFGRRYDSYRRQTLRIEQQQRQFGVMPAPGDPIVQSGLRILNEQWAAHNRTPEPFIVTAIEGDMPSSFETVSLIQDAYFDPSQISGWGLGANLNVQRDTGGRITGVTGVVRLPVNQTAIPAISVVYNPKGLIQRLVNATGTQDFTYDNRGKVHTVTLSYPFTPAGGGSPQTTTEGTFTFDYDAAGRNSVVTFPDGHRRTQQFDNQGRLTSRCYEYTAPAPTRCYGAEYDGSGNPILLSDPEGETVIDYDDTDRLLSTHRTAPGKPDADEMYSYNGLGALHTNASAILDDVRQRLDGAGLASAGVPRTLDGQPVTLTAIGQVQQLRNAAFAYNRRGRLSQIIDGSTQDDYALDPYMHLLMRTRNGVREQYLYSYHDVKQTEPAQREPLANILGVQDDHANIKRRFLYEGPDQPLWMFDQAQLLTAYYEVDTVGNVRRLRAGRQLGSGPSLPSDLGGYRYTVFGKAIAADASTPAPTVPTAGGSVPLDQPLRWQGRWLLDIAGGLYDFRARVWSPDLGAFLQPDEFHYVGENTTLWSWPGQNPFKFHDPSGHETFVTINAAGISSAILSAVNVGALNAQIAFVSATAAVEAFEEEGTMFVEAGESALLHIAENASVDQVVEQLVEDACALRPMADAGYRVAGTQVQVMTSEGKRIIDLLLEGPDGQFVALEVKVTQLLTRISDIMRNTAQVSKDLEMEVGEGGEIVGGALRDDFEYLVGDILHHVHTVEVQFIPRVH